MGEKYEITVTASGFATDTDGNLLDKDGNVIQSDEQDQQPEADEETEKS